MERKIIYKENSEEYKAIKLLEEKTENYSLDGEDLHYANILYNLIINLSNENDKYRNQQKEFIKYLQEELNVQIQEKSVGCEITNKEYILKEILQEYKEIIGGK